MLHKTSVGKKKIMFKAEKCSRQLPSFSIPVKTLLHTLPQIQSIKKHDSETGIPPTYCVSDWLLSEQRGSPNQVPLISHNIRNTHDLYKSYHLYGKSTRNSGAPSQILHFQTSPKVLCKLSAYYSKSLFCEFDLMQTHHISF